MPSATICKFSAPATHTSQGSERPTTDARALDANEAAVDTLTPVDAPAEIAAPGGMIMPCVVGVVSDISMRVWCTRAVAAELAGGSGFILAERLPELTVRCHLPLCKRTITTTAICTVTAARVAEDGGFVLDLRVRRIGVDSSEVVRRFRRERGRLGAEHSTDEAHRAGSA